MPSRRFTVRSPGNPGDSHRAQELHDLAARSLRLAGGRRRRCRTLRAHHSAQAGYDAARLEGDSWIEDPGNPLGNLGRAIAFARTSSVGGEPREWLATADQGLWYRRASSEAWRRHEHPALANLAITDLKRVQDRGV